MSGRGHRRPAASQAGAPPDRFLPFLWGVCGDWGRTLRVVVLAATCFLGAALVVATVVGTVVGIELWVEGRLGARLPSRRSFVAIALIATGAAAAAPVRRLLARRARLKARSAGDTAP